MLNILCLKAECYIYLVHIFNAKVLDVDSSGNFKMSIDFNHNNCHYLVQTIANCSKDAIYCPLFYSNQLLGYAN